MKKVDELILDCESELEIFDKISRSNTRELIDSLKELRDFVHMAHRFRMTAIVDDDFPDIRDEHDLMLKRLIDDR